VRVQRPYLCPAILLQQRVVLSFFIALFSSSSLMKIPHSFLLPVVAACLLSTSACAQNSRPLNGRGPVQHVSKPIRPFAEIHLSGIVGAVIIDASASDAAPRVEVDIDGNLRPLLLIEQKGEQLTIALTGNENNRKWIENTHIVVVVSAPGLQKLTYSGNGNAKVSGIAGKSFDIRHVGNGELLLSGQIESLVIEHEGNGNIQATSLAADRATVVSVGNGSIYVTANTLTKQAAGNGRVVNSKDPVAVVERRELQYVHVTLKNPLGKPDLGVRGPNEDGSHFSYGFGIRKIEKRKERVPVGTEFKSRGVTVHTVTQEDDGKEVNL